MCFSYMVGFHLRNSLQKLSRNTVFDLNNFNGNRRMFLLCLYFNFVSSDSSSIKYGSPKRPEFRILISVAFSWKFRNCRNLVVNLFPRQKHLIYAGAAVFVIATFFGILEIQAFENTLLLIGYLKSQCLFNFRNSIRNFPRQSNLKILKRCLRARTYKSKSLELV